MPQVLAPGLELFRSLANLLSHVGKGINIRIHDLRHNFTSHLQAGGVSDSIIMAITGHKTHVMLHRYSHANDEHKRKALESLPDHNTGGTDVSVW